MVAKRKKTNPWHVKNKIIRIFSLSAFLWKKLSFRSEILKKCYIIFHMTYSVILQAFVRERCTLPSLPNLDGPFGSFEPSFSTECILNFVKLAEKLDLVTKELYANYLFFFAKFYKNGGYLATFWNLMKVPGVGSYRNSVLIQDIWIVGIMCSWNHHWTLYGQHDL